MVTIACSSRMTGADSGRTSERGYWRKTAVRGGWLSLLVSLWLVPGVWAQGTDGRLTVWGGAIVYDDPVLDSVVLIEFPFVLDRDEFSFFQDSADGQWYGRVWAQVRLLDRDGFPVDSASTYFGIRGDPPDNIGSRGSLRLFYSVALLVRPGVYSARLTVIDVVSKNQGDVFYDKVIVNLPPRDRIHVGGVTLAYRIQPAPEENPERFDPLVKNGLRILPNPLRVYGEADSALFLYAELYNLSYQPGSTTRYRLRFEAFDSRGRPFQDWGYVVRPIVDSSAVVVQQFDIGGWPAGAYRLRMIATDLVTAKADTVRVAFRLIGPSTAGDSTFYTTRFPYDTLTLQVQLNLVRYLLTPVERARLERLGPEGKRQFLARFWKERDPDPTTPLNEAQLEYLHRYEYANQHFSTRAGRTDGWRSDRGRIYITRGPADRVQRADVPALTNPFEIWYYYGQDREGAFYVFEDDRSAFEFRLVHSNVRGELYNPRWDRLIRDQNLFDDF